MDHLCDHSHIDLAVIDLAKSRAFYVDTLGLQVTDETAKQFICERLKSAAITASS